MTARKKITRGKIKPLTAGDVGRYLKRLSTLNKDPQLGNPALSVALRDLATLLIASKEQSVREAFISIDSQAELDPEQLLKRDVSALSLSEISELLRASETTRTELIKLGSDRFGIPESKMTKLAREAVLNTIRSALEHEQSIEILSDEASRGGKNRTS
jgi:hypothetical protein